MSDPDAHFRRGDRKPVALRVQFRRSSGSTLAYSGTTSDISLGGAFVETQQPPPEGSHVVLFLSSPTAWEPIEVAAEVRWTRDGGFGARFLDVTGARATALYELLHAHNYEVSR